MPKITVEGGPSNAGDVPEDTPVVQVPVQPSPVVKKTRRKTV